MHHDTAPIVFLTSHLTLPGAMHHDSAPIIFVTSHLTLPGAVHHDTATIIFLTSHLKPLLPGAGVYHLYQTLNDEFYIFCESYTGRCLAILQ